MSNGKGLFVSLFSTVCFILPAASALGQQVQPQDIGIVQAPTAGSAAVSAPPDILHSAEVAMKKYNAGATVVSSSLDKDDVIAIWEVKGLTSAGRQIEADVRPDGTIEELELEMEKVRFQPVPGGTCEVRAQLHTCDDKTADRKEYPAKRDWPLGDLVRVLRHHLRRRDQERREGPAHRAGVRSRSDDRGTRPALHGGSRFQCGVTVAPASPSAAAIHAGLRASHRRRHEVSRLTHCGIARDPPALLAPSHLSEGCGDR